MITLNLIPQSKKDALKLARVYILIKNLTILILILTILVAITLLTTKAALQNYFNNIVSQSTFTTKYANTFVKGIKNFNAQLSAVDSIQKEHIPWTKFLVRFSALVPKNVAIQNLSVNNQKVLIKGLAVSRDQLIELENNLKKDPLFTNVIIPLENLLKRENIDFEVKADVLI